MSDIKVTPLGAGQDVGRSCILLSMGGKNIMLDCGMHMSYHDERKFPDFSFITPDGPITPFIDCVLITHFHVDHCGALPYMSEMVGYTGPIYMTHPTKAIVPLLLEDTVRLFVGKGGKCYSSEMIKDCMKKVTTVCLHEEVMVDNELEIKPYYAGHVLGAVMFRIRVGSRSVVYTGDFNMAPDHHLRAAWIDKCRPNLLITESTYATTIRDSKLSGERDFLNNVSECIGRGGKVLIPVFALGRAQELCLLLDAYWDRLKLKAPIYFASNLTNKANNIYKMFITWTNQKIRQAFSRRNMFAFQHIERFDRRFIDKPGPMVVLASPGMLNSGLSLEIFKRWAPDKRNMVILSGFCAPGTVGYRVSSGAKTLKNEDGSRIKINMSVKSRSFSAHADAKGIMQLIQNCEPSNVMLVHGAAAKMKSFKDKVRREFNIECYTPANGETCVINAPIKINIDVSLPLLRNEAEKFNALPPDSKRVRRLHGVLVTKDDNSACLKDVDEACKEAGIKRHIIRFTSAVLLEDPEPSLRTAHKMYSFLKNKLPKQSVTITDCEINVEQILVKVENKQNNQKTVLVSWINQDEDLGSYVLGLVKSMA